MKLLGSNCRLVTAIHHEGDGQIPYEQHSHKVMSYDHTSSCHNCFFFGWNLLNICLFTTFFCGVPLSSHNDDWK